MFTGVPEVDLSNPEAKTLIVKACKQFSSFKLVHHVIPLELTTNLEDETLKIFMQQQSQKTLVVMEQENWD